MSAHGAEMLDGIDFDSPFAVDADGTITPRVEGVYAPDVWHVEGAQSPDDIEIGGTGWEALVGYTGQHGYRGAVMHASEFLGGRLADDILAEPGVYVVVAVEVLPDTDDDVETEPAGWAVLRRTV